MGRDVRVCIFDVVRSDAYFPIVCLAHEAPDFLRLEKHNLSWAFIYSLRPGNIGVIRWVFAQVAGQARTATLDGRGVLHVFLENLVLLLFLDRLVVLTTGSDAVEGGFDVFRPLIADLVIRVVRPCGLQRERERERERDQEGVSYFL